MQVFLLGFKIREFLMKKYITFLLVILLNLSMGNHIFADDHEDNYFNFQVNFCKLNEGNSMEDYSAAVDDYIKWSKKNDVEVYVARQMPLFPHDNFIGFTDSYKRAVEETDASIILVNTQLGDTGYSAEFVESALTDLAVNLKKSSKEYHLIILSSTVLPGSIQKLNHLDMLLAQLHIKYHHIFSAYPNLHSHLHA